MKKLLISSLGVLTVLLAFGGFKVRQDTTLIGMTHFGGTNNYAEIDGTGVLMFSGAYAGFTAPHGQRSDNTIQTVVNSANSYVITYSSVDDENYGITLSGGAGGSAIRVPRNGDYEFIISAIVKVASNNDYFYLRARRNGVDITGSNTVVRIPASNTETVMAVPFMLDMNANDYVQFVMGASANNAILVYTGAGTNPTRPATPSIIVTAKRVSNQ